LTLANFRSNLFPKPSDCPLWEGQRLGRKKLLVYQDQGVGDAIIGLRFLPILAAKGISFAVWVLPTLADLAVAAPGCANLIKTSDAPDPRQFGCDFVVPFFGLINGLNLSYAEIVNPPPLRPPAGRNADTRAQVAALRGVRIGLSYGGNPNRRDDAFRSLSMDDLLPLTEISGISWVNLTFDERAEKATVMKHFKMLDPMQECRSFADTAAVIDALDAVIAIDSAVAHLAGSLGKRTWVLVPNAPDWRWQIGDHLSPWWPGVRVLRSGEPGKWSDAVTKLVEEVRTYVAG